MQTIFWLTILLPFLSYFGYPLIIWLMGIVAPFTPKKRDITPVLSVIIPAFNEENDIANKIKNTISLDYPNDKIEILIGSDGSTDMTAKIARSLANDRVKFFDFSQNRGKTAVQNDLVARSNGEVLVFTDAASFLEHDALKRIVRSFADPRIGCVAGRMSFVNTDENLTSQSQGVYWSYELKLRQMESKIGNLIGVDGPLYAVRRKYYIPLPSHIISDFLTPLLVLSQDKRVVLEPEAMVYELPTKKAQHEFATRRRITVRGLTGLWDYKGLLNFFKTPLLSLQIILHKVIRWFVGPLILINMVSTLWLFSTPFYRFVFFLYTMLLLGAAGGYLADARGKKPRILTVPYYFVLVNAAATMGIFDFLTNKQAVKWVPVRSSSQPYSANEDKGNYNGTTK